MLLALTACGSGDSETEPAPEASTASAAATEGADDFLAMLEGLDGTRGVPEAEVVQAAEKFCAWRADGGSAELGRDPKTLDLPDYFSEDLMRDIAFTAPRTLCPEALD